MYDIAGEITPRGNRNYMSRDDMSELEDDDEDEEAGDVTTHRPPAKGSAKRDIADDTSRPTPNTQVRATSPSASVHHASAGLQLARIVRVGEFAFPCVQGHARFENHQCDAC